MDSQSIDGHGYPTDKALERIRKATLKDIVPAITDAWNTDYGHASTTLTPAEYEIIFGDISHKYLRLVTGGWSGNEEIITAYEKNFVASSLTWRLSASGGLHILRIPETGED